MIDPNDPSHRRHRLLYEDKGKTIRLCTREVLQKTRLTAKGRVHTIGGVLSRQALPSEWILDCKRRQGRLPVDPDIGAMWPFHDSGLPPGFGHLRKTRDGRWIVERSSLLTFGQWDDRLLDDVRQNRAAEFLHWFYVLEALAPTTLDFTKRDQVMNVTVHVPVDLRFPIDEQWETLQHWLRELQTYVLRLSGRKRASSTRDELLGRNAYCYFLQTRKNLTAREVAEIIFPEERADAAADKVHRIISDFRKRLAAAGIIDPPVVEPTATATSTTDPPSADTPDRPEK